MYTNILRAIID